MQKNTKEIQKSASTELHKWSKNVVKVYTIFCSGDISIQVW